MDRILVLMRTPTFSRAYEALRSAKSAAAKLQALSWGLSLREPPTPADEVNMADFDLLWHVEGLTDLAEEVAALHRGERYILVAHPDMRFRRGWDQALPRILERLTDPQPILTGYLPTPHDPFGAVCTVAADCFGADGRLYFRHGYPLIHARTPMPGPFLHPDFLFARAGTLRMLRGEGPLTLRASAIRATLSTLNRVLITVEQDLEVPPLSIPPESPAYETLREEFGVNAAERTLSSAARHGLKMEGLDVPTRVPPLVVMREGLRSLRSRRQKVQPLCVTVCRADLSEDGLHWLRQLADMKAVSLMCFADPTQMRAVSAFHPNVMTYRERYGLLPPIPEAKPLFSRAGLLSAARDRVLTGSHYVWLDPDCVRVPMYPGTALNWPKVCQKEIVLAKVGGRLDLSMIVVPDARLKPLQTALSDAMLALTRSSGVVPGEEQLWAQVVLAHPDWFSFQVFPVRRQLFTALLGW